MSIFAKIIKREIPASIVFENDKVLAFKDLHPQAPVHLLFVHKWPTSDINDLTRNHPEQLHDLFAAIEQYSSEQGLDKSGFRLVTNLGPHAGQTVFHTHIHFLAGAPLGTFG